MTSATNATVSNLQSFLNVQAPSSLDKSAPVLSFERLRQIDIPWNEILGPLVSAHGASSISPARSYFERSWGFSVSAADFDAEAIAAQLVILPVADDKPQFWGIQFSDPAALSDAEKTSGKYPERQLKADPQQFTDGVVLKDGYGRSHHLRMIGGRAVTANDFESYEAYANFWKSVDGFELCFESSQMAIEASTRVEYVDLTELLILQTYDELKAQQQFDGTLQTEMDKSAPSLVANVVSAGLDIEEVDRLQQTITSVRRRKYDNQRRLERLAQKAAELGYMLWVSADAAKDIEFPDGSKRAVQPGQLYRQYRHLYRWTTTIDRVECAARQGLRKVTSFFGIESPEPYRWKEKKSHSAVVEDVKLVNVNDNALADKVAELAKRGTALVFAKTDKGYFTQEGTALRDVMMRCERDEDFRQRCSVLLPVIETSLSGRQAIKGYNVFVAPFPGIVPTALPQLSVQESLSYRMAWQGTQLGPLVNSINLAPGETRSITVRRSYEQETTYAQSRTTIFDLQESETTDISTEVEKELYNQNTAGWNLAMSDSINASGNVEGVNVGASASRSFGYNQSISSVSRSVAKLVKKTSQSINRNYKDEVSTDTKQTTRIANFDEYTSNVSNINEGRTLNILFYRLFNAYKSGLYLDDIRFHVTPSVETIAGSGIRESVSFDHDELDQLLDQFAVSQLPYDMNEADETDYWRLVVENLEKLLDEEYGAGGGANDSAPRAAAVIQMGPPKKTLAPPDVKKVSTAKEEYQQAVDKAESTRKAAYKKFLQQAEAAFEATKASVKYRLSTIKLIGNCLDEQNIQLVSPGLYVDALVGSNPSTEEYSERMREQVVAMKRAEVQLAEAEALYKKALAARVGEGGGNWIVGAIPVVERNSLLLSLKSPLAAGKWSLLLDGKSVGEIPEDQYGNYTVNVAWPKPQSWLGDADLAARRLELYSADEGRLIGQLAK